MAKIQAQQWLENIENGTGGFTTAIPKANLVKILESGTGITNANQEVENPGDSANPGNELLGKIVLEDYINLEEIYLSENEITEVVIKNCPKLHTINVRENRIKILDLSKIIVGGSGNGVNNLIKQLTAGANQLERLDLTKCNVLEILSIPDNPNLKKIKGSTVHINEITVTHTPAEFVTSEDLNSLKDIKDWVKNELGVSFKDEENSSRDWKETAKANAAGQVANEKKAAEKEAKEVKDELSGVETKRDQLKQQLDAINKELGLGDDATEKQILDKIKELKGRPPLTDINAVRSENDSLQEKVNSLKNEVETKKRKISELEGAENKEKDVITKKVLVDTTNTGWKDLGIKLTDEQEKKIENASSVTDVEAARSEIIKSEFNKLKSKNNNSTVLSAGLGVLAIGSLLILGWVLVKQNSSLPQIEPKKDKDKEK